MDYSTFVEMDKELTAINIPKIPPGQIYWWDWAGTRNMNYDITEFPIKK